MSLTTGKHYFVRNERRVDEFASKRFTTPELVKREIIVVMGELIEHRGQEVKVKLTGNNFERDGGEYVFSQAELLTFDGSIVRTLEDHGKPSGQLGRWIPVSG